MSKTWLHSACASNRLAFDCETMAFSRMDSQFNWANSSSFVEGKYILVAVDYFTKWVEAIPLKEVTQAEIIDFIEEHIVYRFGIQ